MAKRVPPPGPHPRRPITFKKSDLQRALDLAKRHGVGVVEITPGKITLRLGKAPEELADTPESVIAKL